MDVDEARERFARARVARLATADSRGIPHLVPIVFAVDRDVVYSAVDRKPKRSYALRRLANLAANPNASVLVDHFDDDWNALWWVRADGLARILEPESEEARHAVDLLAARYHQYLADRPDGPVIALDVQTWSGWDASCL